MRKAVCKMLVRLKPNARKTKIPLAQKVHFNFDERERERPVMSLVKDRPQMIHLSLSHNDLRQTTEQKKKSFDCKSEEEHKFLMIFTKYLEV